MLLNQLNRPNIIRILPQLCQIITDVLNSHIIPIHFFSEDQLSLEELGNVDDGRDDNNRYDIHEDPEGLIVKSLEDCEVEDLTWMW